MRLRRGDAVTVAAPGAWLATLLQDLRYGARVLRRAPRFTVAVVLVLGLGVGVTTAVFAIVDSLMLNAVPFAESHRLVELYRWGPTGGGPLQPAAMVRAGVARMGCSTV